MKKSLDGFKWMSLLEDYTSEKEGGSSKEEYVFNMLDENSDYEPVNLDIDSVSVTIVTDESGKHFISGLVELSIEEDEDKDEDDTPIDLYQGEVDFFTDELASFVKQQYGIKLSVMNTSNSLLILMTE